MLPSLLLRLSIAVKRTANLTSGILRSRSTPLRYASRLAALVPRESSASELSRLIRNCANKWFITWNHFSAAWRSGWRFWWWPGFCSSPSSSDAFSTASFAPRLPAPLPAGSGSAGLILPRLRHLNFDFPAAQFLTAHRVEGGVGVALHQHLDEAETLGASGFAIARNVHLVDGGMRDLGLRPSYRLIS
jgi:hypothetical protein